MNLCCKVQSAPEEGQESTRFYQTKGVHLTVYLQQLTLCFLPQEFLLATSLSLNLSITVLLWFSMKSNLIYTLLYLYLPLFSTNTTPSSSSSSLLLYYGCCCSCCCCCCCCCSCCFAERCFPPAVR